MLRVVLDTNVIVSALLSPRGAPGRIIERLLAEEFVAVLSPALLGEFKRAIAYPRVRRFLRLSPAEIDAAIAHLESLSDLVSGAVEVELKLRDAKDLPVLAAAIEGRASYVVTGDQDLLVVGEMDGILIVSPRTFLEILGR